ncbi:phage tail tape measure protein [Bacillus sp. SCS-151]|uniref:phage tail tape measure protein n=1 Tax=Nanhaiella sioensis TaxID=3115293 RepID=UPI00397DA996
MSDLRIKIIGTLNETKTVTHIQQQLKSIEKKLNLQIGVDTKLINNISEKVQQLQATINQNSKGIKIIDDQVAIKNIDTAKKGIRELYTDIDKAVKQYSTLGNVKIGQNLNPVTKELENFTLTVTKADGIVEKLKFNLAKIETPEGLQNVFELDSKKVNDDRERITENILQQENQIKSTIKKQNDNLKHQLNIYKQQAEVNVMKLKRKYGDSVDNNELNNYLSQVNSLSEKTPKLKQQMDNLDMSFKRIGESVQTAASHTLSFSEQMKIAITRTGLWGIATTSIYGTIRSIQQMWEEIKLVDEAMTELKRVMDATPKEYNDLLKESIQLSTELGNNVHNVLKAINGFARAGQYTNDQLLALAETATVGSNVSELTANQAMNNMISTMNVFKIEAQETMSIMDKMNEVDNNFAVSTKQISDAMARSSSVANTYGVSLDELIGDITSIASVTFESGSVIGNSLKTIYSRITTMSEAETALNDIGIGIRNLDGTTRDVSDIIGELRGKWDNLTNTQQQNLAVTLAGRYQLSRFIAMMSNAQTAISATETSINSQGSALKENEKYLESIQAKINTLQNSFTSLSISIGENGFTDLMINFFESLTFMTNGFVDLTEATNGWNIKLPLLVAGVYGLSKAFKVLSVAAKGAKLSLGWIGAILVGLELLGTSIAGLAKSNDEAANSFIDSAKKYEDNASRLETLIQKYNDLKPQIDKNSDAQAEYKDVLNEISLIAPQVIEVTDKYGDSLEVNKKKADDFVNSLRSMSDEQLKNADTLLSNSLVNAYNDLDNLHSKQAKSSKEVQEMFNFIIKYNEKYGVSSYTEAVNEYQKRTREELGLFGAAAQEASQEFMKYHNIIQGQTKDLKKYQETMEEVNEAQSKVDDIKNRLKHIQFLSGEYQNLSNIIKQTFDNKIATDIYFDFDKSQIESLIAFGDEFNSNKENIKEYIPILEEAGITQDKIDQIVTNLTTDLQVNSEAIGENLDELDKLVETFNNATTSIQTLSSIIEELNEGHGLSADSIATIMEKYPSLLQYINDEAILLEQLKIKQKEEEQVALGVLYSKLSGNETFINESLRGHETWINELVEMYGIDLTQFATLAEKKAAIEDKLINSIAKKWSDYYDVETQQFNDRAAMLFETDPKMAMRMWDEVKEYENVVNRFKDIVLDPIDINFDEFKASSPSSSKSSSSSEKEIEKYITDEYAKAIDNLSAKLKESEHRQSSLSDTSEEYRNELQQQIDLHKQQQSLTENEINRLISNKNTLLSQIKAMGDFNKLSNENKDKYNELSKEIDDHEKSIHSLRSSYLDTQESISSLTWDRVQSEINSLSEAIDKLDYHIDRSSKVQSTYNDSSEQYRSELEKQNELLSKKEDQIIEQRETIKSLVRQEQLSAEQQKELSEQLDDLSLAYWDVKNQIDSVNRSLQESLWAEVTELIKEHTDALEDLDHELAMSQERMSLYEEGSKEYISELEKQIKLIREKQKETKKEMALIEEQLESEKLTVEQKEELNEQLDDLSLSMLQYENSIQDVNDTLDGLIQEQKEIVSSLAEDVVDIYKEIYEKQKEVALEAIDDELDALEKSHDRKINLLEEEEQKYDDIYNAKIKSLEQEYAEEDYEKELADKQKERFEIEERLNNLSLDNSFEGKAKREELQEELNEVISEIEQLQQDRNRDLRKENLEDDHDAIKKEIQQQKDKYEERLEDDREYYERKREKIERHWENVINDERRWNEIRRMDEEELLSLLKEDYGDFADFFDDNSKVIGKSVSENITDRLKDLRREIKDTAREIEKLAEENDIEYSSYSSYSHSPSSSSSSKNDDEEIRRIAREHDVDLVIAESMHETNKRLGYEKYHEGGIVGGNSGSPSRLTQLVNKFLNDKPNEQTITALKNEVMSPQSNILENFGYNAKRLTTSMISSIGLNSRPTSTPVPAANVNNHYILNIDKLTGDKSGAKLLIKEFSKEMTKRGYK